MRFVLIVMVLALSACSAESAQPQQEAWETAPADYVCTDEQQAKVERQAQWCDVHTSYFSSYCYGSAYIRNCTKRATP